MRRWYLDSMDLSNILSVLTGVLSGAALLCVLAYVAVLQGRKSMHAELAEHREHLAQKEQEIRDLVQRLDEAQSALQRNEAQAHAKELDLVSRLKVAEARAEEQLLHHERLNTELVKSQERLQKEFEALTSKIFEDSRKKFEDDSKKTLDLSLTPLKKEIEGFRKRVEESHREDIAGRNRLEGQIREMQQQAQQIGRDAVQLAAALKGDSKSQGGWGEMVLERLLEDSGLEKGREYETQGSYTDEEGGNKRPDVVIHLPDQKDIVVDAKVSLKAYETFFNAETETEQEVALKEHRASIRNHVNGLSGKDYEKLEGINTLDFVFMFVSVEPAYTLALQSDQSLFQYAYDKGVVIVSPTTLMATLRTVVNIWRYEKQNRYAQQIADEAGGLYDQFVLMVESLDDVGRKIAATQSSYEQARRRLSEGRGNLVRRVDKLRTLGAKSKKALPASVKGLAED